MIGWTQVDTCPSCRGRDRHLLTQILYPKEECNKVKDYIEIDKNGKLMIQGFLCRCGLAYAGRYPDDLETYYYDLYPIIQSLPTARGYIDQPDLEEQRAERVVSEWKIPSMEFAKLLDVGCATGAFLERMRDTYHPEMAVGVDIGDEWPDEEFDVITMIHVLEHTPDPIEFLIGLHDYMKHQGVLFVEVPALALDSSGGLSINHPICFTGMSLRDVLYKGGFMVEAVVHEAVEGPIGQSVVLQAYARKL
jgi:SAM-dependent methyltransferase